jgi:hypothetical protein
MLWWRMPKTIRYTLLSLRDLWSTAGPFIVLTVSLLVLAYWWLDPNPPKRVTLATGPAQSAYEEFGKRYASILAQDGIEVVLLPSQGSADNLQMVRAGQADLGFVQGGTSELQPDDEENLESLGSLFVEPVWLFYREDAARKRPAASPPGARSAAPPARETASVGASGRSDGPPRARPAPSGGSAAREAASVGAITSLTQLQGWRVNTGTPGSGIPNLMNKLLASNKVDPASLTISELEQTPATMALLAGELDAIVFASAPESLMVQMLLQTPGIALMDFPQSEAYSRRFAFLSPVVLPRGVVDLAANVPPRDVRLVAPTTALISHKDTHPALLQLFVQAGNTLHGGSGWFKRAREYPNLLNNELPISAEAERSIKNDKPFLQRYLPFWVANLVERMWLVMGIIIAVMLPLSRILPPLYEFRVRSRIFRWYGQLREIESHIDSGNHPQAVLEELGDLEARAEKIAVPLSYTDELYALRANIHLVRKKLLRTESAPQ